MNCQKQKVQQQQQKHASTSNNIKKKSVLLKSPLNNFNSLILPSDLSSHQPMQKNSHPTGNRNQTADCSFCFSFCILGIIVSYSIFLTFADCVHTAMFAQVQLCAFYLWSKRNPNRMIQLNYIPIQSKDCILHLLILD